VFFCCFCLTLHLTAVILTTKAMASKGAKETLVSKLGFKSNSSGSKAEAELEKVRKENAHLRKKIDELAKRHIKPPDSDKSKLLERILSLETLRERNNQQLLVKEQELETLRQQLSAKGGEVCTLDSSGEMFSKSHLFHYPSIRHLHACICKYMDTPRHNLRPA
ncbi:hypothetical protein ATANTOWER_014708, partial [Ataeniobius toweri]|nr:hypothetical protein [Ataeniobius toweri]